MGKLRKDERLKFRISREGKDRLDQIADELGFSLSGLVVHEYQKFKSSNIKLKLDKPVDKKLSVLVTIRVNSAFKKEILEQASNHGVKVSRFLRSIINDQILK